MSQSPTRITPAEFVEWFSKQIETRGGDTPTSLEWEFIKAHLFLVNGPVADIAPAKLEIEEVFHPVTLQESDDAKELKDTIHLCHLEDGSRVDTSELHTVMFELKVKDK